MVFLGTTFCSGRNSLLPPATPLKTIISIQIFDGVYNHLFLSSDPNLTSDNYNEWNYDTKMNATFDRDLTAGNSGFSVKTTDEVVIRRRESGTIPWTVIFVQPINTVDDFNIHFIDKYAKAGVEYEYSCSSFINNIENSYIIENVYSDFDGYYITDKDCLYGTIYNIDGCDTTRNIEAQALNLLNSKYMSVVSNSDLNCDSGSMSGTFVKINCDNNEIDDKGSLQYRNDVKDRLANKKPLILKIHDGRIWMIRVTGGIIDSQDGHPSLRKIAFEWVEIGDFNDMKTLYNYGLSDVDSRWW